MQGKHCFLLCLLAVVSMVGLAWATGPQTNPSSQPVAPASRPASRPTTQSTTRPIVLLPNRVEVGGSWSGVAFMEGLKDQCYADSGLRLGVMGRPNRDSFKLLAQRRIEVLIYSPVSEDWLAADIKNSFPNSKYQPVQYALGRYAVLVFVNKQRDLGSLSLEQFSKVLRGETTAWKDLNGGEGTIRIVGEESGSKADEIVKLQVLHGKNYDSKMVRLSSPREVIRAVIKDKDAIGFCLDNRSGSPDVRCVSLQKGPTDKPVTPAARTILEGEYPLMERLLLYRLPDSREQATAVCEYVTSERAQKLAETSCLYLAVEEQRLQAEKRLTEWRQGKGVRIVVAGPQAQQKVVMSLAEEYARAKAVLQVTYIPETDLTSLGLFVSGRADLLVTNGPPEAQSMEVHKQKWADLWQQTGGMPKMYSMPGKSLAIIVNEKSKLESLTREQLKAIFTGTTRSWSQIRGDKDKNNEPPIKLYGVKSSDVQELFREQVLSGAKSAAIEMLQSPNEVAQAVAMDPLAIGFMDATHLAGKTGIRVLSISRGKESNIIAKEIRLYVRPGVTKTAEEFLEFVQRGGDASNRFNRAATAISTAFSQCGLQGPRMPGQHFVNLK